VFLEFSKDFEKSRKFWWGRRGREGGLGGWWVIPYMSLNRHVLVVKVILKQVRSTFQTWFELGSWKIDSKGAVSLSVQVIKFTGS